MKKLLAAFEIGPAEAGGFETAGKEIIRFGGVMVGCGDDEETERG